MHPRSIMLDELARIVACGEAILFTGAGFSADARDVDGRPLPDTETMRRELWPLVFGATDGPDHSTLQDLYDVGLMRAPDRLREYLERRLSVGTVPPHFATWFRAPWARIYTLNVDDLEDAVRREYDAPAIEVVHLNGKIGGDVTFSTTQYASRLIDTDGRYQQLVEDLERAPFVFAGTTLDEVTLWQHLERRRRVNGTPPHPRAFLVCREISRAREILLESLGIRWIRASISDVASRLG